MSKFKPEEDNSTEGTPVIKEKAPSADQQPAKQKEEEQIVNLETYASASGLTFQAKSRLQYLVDSNQIKKEMTFAAWDEALKGC